MDALLRSDRVGLGAGIVLNTVLAGEVIAGDGAVGRVRLLLHHEDLLHAPVLQVVQLLHCVLRPRDQVHENARRVVRTPDEVRLQGKGASDYSIAMNVYKLQHRILKVKILISLINFPDLPVFIWKCPIHTGPREASNYTSLAIPQEDLESIMSLL